MKTALIFPPSCDPTSPYISVPLLTGFLRSNGVQVIPIDANIEGFRFLLEKERLEDCLERLRARFNRLDSAPSLDHSEQLEYAAVYRVITECAAAPGFIADARSLMHGKSVKGFYDPSAYYE